MQLNDFDTKAAWTFINQESVTNAPKVPLSEPRIRARAVLLKLQVLLGQYEKENDIPEKTNLLMRYTFLKKLYSDLINNGLS